MSKQQKNSEFWIHMDTVDYFFELSRNIAYYRRLRGLTQNELATKIGVTRSYLSHIESPNAPSHFSMDLFLRICTVLEVAPENMFNAEKFEVK